MKTHRNLPWALAAGLIAITAAAAVDSVPEAAGTTRTSETAPAELRNFVDDVA